MNINVLLNCNTCNKLSHCRVGLSYNNSQPLRFVCQTCRSPIDVEFKYKTSLLDAELTFKGATRQDERDLSDADHFIDLHLDFPVHYGEYISGMTPFLRAIEMIGFENVSEFVKRIGIIDQRVKESKDIKTLIRLYLSENWEFFKKTINVYLPEDKFPCDLPVDRNKCLYQLLDLAFMAHNNPEDNFLFVKSVTHDLLNLVDTNPQVLKDFLDEIISSGFLKDLQKDSLEVYPRILDAHLFLRPAIFLDYLETPDDNTIPLRVSNSEFDGFKDLFKDMSEILSRQLILVAGLSNIKMRGSHNQFDTSISGTPSSLEKFADISYGKKMNFIDEPVWHTSVVDVVDNRLRNAIAHYKTDYDGINQIITYYPHLERLQRSRSGTITFLEFSRKILETFRLMHKLNHVIKILYVFHYLQFQENEN